MFKIRENETPSYIEQIIMASHIDYKGVTALLTKAAAENRNFLFEHEVYRLIECIGGETTPKFHLLKKDERLQTKQLESLPSSKVVVKIVSPYILHKSDVGGVVICNKTTQEVLSTIRRMSFEIPNALARILNNNPENLLQRYDNTDPDNLNKAIVEDIIGYLLCQYMEPDSREFGNELLISLRNTREFGMILSAGLGGRDTELYAARFRKGQAVVSAAVDLVDGSQFFSLFTQTISYKKLAGLTRGQKRIVTDGQLRECFEAMILIGRYFSPSNTKSEFTIDELEVNPFAFSNYLMMPLDGLCRFSRHKSSRQQLHFDQIDNLLHPKSIGIAGVSAQTVNIGRIILDNIVAAGFPKDQLTLIHPVVAEICSIPTTADISDVGKTLDLLVLAIEGSSLPPVIDYVIENYSTRSVILISGELGKPEIKEPHISQTKKLQDKIITRRRGGKKTPIFIGGNSLGILSHPGSYDTMFIPDSKLPKNKGHHLRSTVLVSQSGAYMITRMSKLSFLDPAYAISIGNQIDITAGNFLNYLNTIDSIRTLAFYIEGFTDLDGFNFAKGVEKSTSLGKEVIFYKAGRTQEGKDALSGHTASIAGDYMVCESCIGQAGAMVAETFAIFEGLLRLSSTLHLKSINGNKLAAVSNAGYEAVGIADNIIGDDYRLEMASYPATTEHALQQILSSSGLGTLASLSNPFDITPMASESVYLDIIEVLLKDETIDVVVVAVVPLTPMLDTLPEELNRADNDTEHAFVESMSSFNRQFDKPIIIVVDSGQLFDPMAERFENEGLPVFRSADICITVLGKYIQTRLANKARQLL